MIRALNCMAPPLMNKDHYEELSAMAVRAHDRLYPGIKNAIKAANTTDNASSIVVSQTCGQS